MAACANCGRVNPDEAQFCMSCAAALAPEHVHEVRKTVSIVFSDVTDSTAIGEHLDPETLRHMMGRYFDEMRAVIERHGGSVEKFIGDAVMALFGVPRVHEDDALRAVRAAMEMHEALAILNTELERDRGAKIAIRIGVNTGEVVAGTGDQTVATGDAVNVAARLEQAAQPGEVLIGEATYALVRDAIVAEALEPLQLKGKSTPVSAYRLKDVSQRVRGRLGRTDSAMVGRSREFVLLGQAFDRALSDRTCQLVTIVGQAGVGKSRLVREFLASVGSARVLQGRCLPYGEGITYFPVIEVVKDAAGLLDFDAPEAIETKVCSILDGTEHQELVCRRVAQLLGVGEVASPDETFWAIRHFLEAIARDAPLFLVFDDIHWGESLFLDLVDHIADTARDVPILICCLARPDLLDDRPAWGGRPNALTVSLEPLSTDESGALIGNLLSAADVQDEVRRRIADAAEGNPLFIEEMLSMLIDDGLIEKRGDRWTQTRDLSQVAVPPTIAALLAAGLDRLSPNQRAVLEAASVAGQEFVIGAVRELAPEKLRNEVPAQMLSLVRKEFVRRDRSTDLGEEAFHFRHLLIRDAAYEAMPKELRAGLHERFAGWLEGVAGERIQEQEEVLGYHLESAHDYLAELGMTSGRVRALGARAAQALGSAGRRAHSRGDMAATRNLMRRAVALLPIGNPDRIEMLPDLAEALEEAGEDDVALSLIDEALSSVQGRDARLEAHLRLARRQLIDDGKERWAELAERDARSAIDVFTTMGDEAGEAKAWRMLGFVEWRRGKVRGAETAWRRAIEHGDRAGGVTASAADLAWLTVASYFGPEPAHDALRRSQAALEAVKEIASCAVPHVVGRSLPSRDGGILR